MKRPLIILAFLVGALIGGLLSGVAGAANDAKWADCAAMRPALDSLKRELDVAAYYVNRNWNDLAKVQRACRRRR